MGINLARKWVVGPAIAVVAVAAGFVGVTLVAWGSMGQYALRNSGLSDFQGWMIYMLIELIALLASMGILGLGLRLFKQSRIWMGVLMATGLILLVGWVLSAYSPLGAFIYAGATSSDWWDMNYLPYVPEILVAALVAAPVALVMSGLKSKKAVKAAGILCAVLWVLVVGDTVVGIYKLAVLQHKSDVARKFTVYDVTYVPTGMRLFDRGFVEGQGNDGTITSLTFSFVGSSKYGFTVQEFDVTKAHYKQSNCGPASLNVESPVTDCALLGVTASGYRVYGSPYEGYPGYVRTAYVTIGGTRIIITPGSDSSVAGMMAIAGGLKQTPKSKLPEYSRD